jgi:regulator of replication initiation timing
VLALQLANKQFRDKLADARLKLKGVAKVNNNKKQLGNQLEAKHQLMLIVQDGFKEALFVTIP